MKNLKLSCFLLSLVIVITGMMSGCNLKRTESKNQTSGATETHTTESAAASVETKPVETEPRKIQAPSMTREEFPGIDGSTATIPLSTALYQLVTGATPQEAEATISHTKTTNAYMQLIYGNENQSLVLAYEPSAAVYDAMKEHGVNLILKPIGKDALVFMANEGNSVESLTEQQLVNIYRGDIKNWSQLGGADKEIMAFQRPQNSGSQTLMEKLVMKDIPMDDTAPTSSIIGDMGELIERVATYNNEENALGYSVYFYARNMYEKPELRFMKVNGILPSNETIKSGAYPYVNEFYAAIREDEPKDSKAYELFEWLTETDGQALIESLGYVGKGKSDENPPLQSISEMQTKKAQIQFETDERLILDGQYAYGADGVVILDDEMNITQIVKNVRFPANVATIRLNEPVILNGPNAYVGLYNLETGNWLVPPEYSALYKNEDGTYGGYKEAEDGGFRVVLTSTEDGFEIKEHHDYQLEDCIWNVDSLQKKAVITDSDGSIIKEIDFRQWGDFGYGYVQEPFYVAEFREGNVMLFSADGNVLFQKSFLPEAFQQKMRNLNPTGEEAETFSLAGVSHFANWVCGSYGEQNHLFIYDIKRKKVVTEPGDQIELYYFEDEDGYIVTRDSNVQAYSRDGNPLTSPTGHPYEYVAGDGYYGYQEGNQLILENRNLEKTYAFQVTGVKSVNHMCGDVFGVETEEEKSVYKGKRCLMKGEGIGWWTLNQDYQIVTDYKSHHIGLNREGTIIYESRLEEDIVYLCEELLAVQRGSYLHILDYEGKSAMKILLGYLGND